jgi:hypothetical protein
MTVKKRQTASQRRAERRREARDRVIAARSDHSGVSDSTYGMTLRPNGPGGRLQLRWTVDPYPYHALCALPYVRNALLGVEQQLVREARAAGISWDELGFALDQSGEAVRRRWADALDT